METIHSNYDNPKRQHQASRLTWHLSLGGIKYCVPRTGIPRTGINRGLLSTVTTILLLLTACDNTASNSEKWPPLATRYQATEQYPDGYSDVQMGDYFMRVSHTITPHIHPNGVIRLYLIWPEAELYSTASQRRQYVRPSGRQRQIDTIEIYISPPRRGPHEGEPHQVAEENRKKMLQRRIEEHQQNKWRPSIEFPEYEEKLNPINGQPEFYSRIAQDIIMPTGRPFEFYCSSLSFERYQDISGWDRMDDSYESRSIPGSSPTCSLGASWPDGHGIYVRFKTKHKRDALEIYQKVMALHNSLIVTGPTLSASP